MHKLAEPKQDLLQSVQRACRILHLLAEARRPLAPRDIAEQMGINLSTTYHLTNTLESEGMVRRDQSRRLVLGPRVGELHDAFEEMFVPDQALLNRLELLHERTGETTYLATWDGDEVVSVAVREGKLGVRVRGLHLGYREHAYARSVGRALLAFRTPEFIDNYLKREKLVALTDYTTTDPDQLRQQLAEVRTTGIAAELQEFTVGVCCIAAPIFDPAGVPTSALSVSVPKARYDAEGDELAAVVAAVAAEPATF